MEKRIEEINRLIKFFPGERGRELWIGTLVQDFIGIYNDLFEELPGYVRYTFLERFGEFIERELKEIKELRSAYGKEFEKIREAKDALELAQVRKTLTRITGKLFEKTYAVMETHEFCTQYHDHLTQQAVRLVEASLRKEKGKPRGQYAWIRMGSAGREEQTLTADQDHLLVYERAEDASYFRRFSERMVSGLEKIGFAQCLGDTMATNPRWRGTFSEWKKRIKEMTQKEEEQIGLMILMDAKYSAGDPELAQQFIQMVRKETLETRGFLREFAKTATLMPVALTLFRRFKTERSGKHKGKFNAKLEGWMPLVMTTLVFALKYGVLDTNTVKRIRALEKQGHFEPDFSANLQEAYFMLTRVKILKQIAALKEHRKPDYYVNPNDLPPKQRQKLHEALLCVDQLKRIAYSSFHLSAADIRGV